MSVAECEEVAWVDVEFFADCFECGGFVCVGVGDFDPHVVSVVVVSCDGAISVLLEFFMPLVDFVYCVCDDEAETVSSI